MENCQWFEGGVIVLSADYLLIVVHITRTGGLSRGLWVSSVCSDFQRCMLTGYAASGPFVETLFQTLHSKNYDLTQTLPVPAAASHPIPTGPAAEVAPRPSAGPSTMQNGQQKDVIMQEMPVGVSGRRKCRDYHGT